MFPLRDGLEYLKQEASVQPWWDLSQSYLCYPVYPPGSHIQSSESFSVPGETWVVFSILTLRAQKTRWDLQEPSEPKGTPEGSPADPVQLFPGEHFQGFLTSHVPGKPWAGKCSGKVLQLCPSAFSRGDSDPLCGFIPTAPSLCSAEANAARSL